jgi:HEAT repeat protein
VNSEAAWIEGLRASGGLGLALVDPDPQVRARVLNGLQPLDAPEIGPLLLPLLDDPIEGVANSALRAVLRLRRSEDLFALLERLEGLEEPEERDTFLQIFSWGLRSHVEEQLTDGFRARLLGLALPLLEAPMASTRAAAIALLRIVQSPEGTPRLRALLREDPDDDVRLAAVNLLAELDYPERVEDMGWALDVGLAPHAPLQALGGSGAPEALPPLVRYLERAGSYNIHGALTAILRLHLPACQRWAVLALKNTDGGSGGASPSRRRHTKPWR